MPPRKQLPPIEIRDQRLRGGRMSISARTDNRVEWRRREAAVRGLMAGGHIDLVERLRSRKDTLHIADVARAVTSQDIDSLRALGRDSQPLTLQANVDRILEMTEATKAEGTLHQYQVICKQLIERFDGDTLITEITFDALRAWIHEPKATTGNKPWSGARQLLAKALVGRLFKVAIDVEADAAERTRSRARITRNPTKAIEVGDINKRAEFLRPAEWQALSRACEGRAVHVLVALGALAGLRAGEAANLRKGIDIEDIDGARPRIRIQAREGQWKWKPKNRRRGTRVVPVGTELHRIIRSHIDSGFSGDVYLIKTPTGEDRPMARQNIQSWTKQAFEAAGIRYGRDRDALTHHSLRHTFISWLVQADVSLKKIETLAGTSVKMILETYGHLIDDDLEKAISIVDERARES